MKSRKISYTFENFKKDNKTCREHVEEECLRGCDAVKFVKKINKVSEEPAISASNREERRFIRNMSKFLLYDGILHIIIESMQINLTKQRTQTMFCGITCPNTVYRRVLQL
jgi:hypothetical protein